MIVFRWDPNLGRIKREQMRQWIRISLLHLLVSGWLPLGLSWFSILKSQKNQQPLKTITERIQIPGYNSPVERGRLVSKQQHKSSIIWESLHPESWHFSPGLRAAPGPSTWQPGCTATRVAGGQDQFRSHPFRPAQTAHLMAHESRHAWVLFSRDPGFRSPAGSYWRGVYCDPSSRSAELPSSGPSVGNVCWTT